MAAGILVEHCAGRKSMTMRYQIRGKHIHDANIVAVMLPYGVHRLATYNQRDFLQFDEIVLEAAPVEDSSDLSPTTPEQ
jgi:hypothetical protein